METTPERELGGPLHADVEPLRAEHARIGVRTHDEQGEEGAGRNPQAIDFEIFGGDPPDGRDRRPHAHDFLDRPGSERGLFGQPRPLLWVCQEGGQRAAQLVAGGVLAGEHQRRH